MARNVNIAINERIRAILNDVFHGNVSAMAKATYINRNTLNSIVGEKEVTPGYDVIRHIVEMSTPQISIDWLITGNGEMIDTPVTPDTTVSASQQSVANTGNNSVVLNAPCPEDSRVIESLRKEISYLERILSEKERFITHLTGGK